MVRHVLGGFERPAVMQRYRDSRPAERVIAEGFRQARSLAAVFDHVQHVAAVESLSPEPLRLREEPPHEMIGADVQI